jgi:hypothetical protein
VSKLPIFFFCCVTVSMNLVQDVLRDVVPVDRAPLNVPLEDGRRHVERGAGGTG